MMLPIHQFNRRDNTVGARNPNENVNRVLDTVIARLALKNDAALSRLLEMTPSAISKLRHGRLALGASVLLRMQEVSGIDIRELKDVLENSVQCADGNARTFWNA